METIPMQPDMTTEYLMGRSSTEYQRLRAQAAIWEPATRRAFAAIDLRPGMNCLEVGSGPGEVMRLLGTLVGPTGHVTGFDADARLGRESLGILRAKVGSQFSFHTGDLETLPPLPNGPFDLVYARLTMIHLNNPGAVLRHLWASVKPGGTLLIQDYDLSYCHLYPATWAFEEFERVMLGTFEAGGKDCRLGSRMPLLFVEAGIGAPTGTDVYGVIEPLDQFAPMLSTTYQSLLPAALKAGVTTVAQSRRFFAELPELATSGTYHTSGWPLMIATWACKPRLDQHRCPRRACLGT